jgi:ABC-type transport system involved in multi-copper enzyme maturation permease subunit
VTGQSVALEPVATGRRPRTPFLGFRNVFRKEVLEWMRGRGALVVGIVSIGIAVFTALLPFLQAATAPAGTPPLSRDPTVNVLLGWNGQSTAIVALLATMGLISTERDRGTLAWSLTNPVSPTSIIAGKFAAALLVFGAFGVVLPLAVSVVVATVAYGAPPDLAVVGRFAVLYLMVPAFFIAVTVAVGTAVKATAGVAAVGFLVLLAPPLFGALVPVVNEISPTSIARWVSATANGQAASTLTLVGWVVSMTALAIGAKLVFDRQEF